MQQNLYGYNSMIPLTVGPGGLGPGGFRSRWFRSRWFRPSRLL